MIKIMKKIFKNIIKEKILKEEFNSISENINVLTKETSGLKLSVITLEKENDDLKIVIENLTVAYLDLAKTLMTENKNSYKQKNIQDDYLDQMLKLFNSEQNDDDLIN